MASIPKPARPAAWKPSPARIEGDRLLKARQLEQRVRDQALQAKAEAQRAEEQVQTDLKQEVNDLDEKLDQLISNLPKIVPGAGSGRKTIRKVIERDFPNVATLGTASQEDIGTSGSKVPKLNASNTWSALQTFAAGGVLGDEESDPVTIKSKVVSSYSASLLEKTGSAAWKSTLGISASVNYISGGWVTATAYSEGDWLVYNNNTYIATAPHTSDASSEPGTGVDWADYWDANPFGTPTVLDEDDFATDSTTAAPSQQSVKAFFNARSVSSVAALAAANTTAHPIVFLSEERRSGFFETVNASDWTDLLAADTENGMIVASTYDAAKARKRLDIGVANIKYFGAVDDGTIDVNDYSGRPSYANIAAVEAATITDDPEIILVKGMPYRIVDEDHQKLGGNRITGNPTAGTGWSIVGSTATKVAGTASSLTYTGMLPPAGTSVLVEFEATRTAGSMSVVLGVSGSAMTGVGATVTYRQIGTCGTGRNFFLSAASGFEGTVDLSTVSIRPIFGVISSANGIFYAPVNPLFMPFGTGDVTGTDNHDAIQCAINVAELMGIPVYVPPGKFKVDIGQVNRTVILEVGKRFHMFGEPGQSWIIANDDKDWLGLAGQPQTGNVFIGQTRFYETGFNTATPENYNLDINEYFIMRGVGVQSTWWRDMEKRQRAWLNPTAVGASGPYRCQMLAPVNTSYVSIENCKIWDVMGTAIYACSNREVNYFNNDLRRLNGNGLRSENAMITRMHHNMVLHCDDDSVSITDQDDRPNSYGPREHFASFCDNIIIASEGPLMMGNFDLTMTGNKLFLCYGTGLAVFNMPVEGAGQGGGGTAFITIKDNIVLNQMQANDRQIIPDGTWEASECEAVLLRGATQFASTTTYPLGQGTATPLNQPWYSGDYPWGGLHLSDQVGDGTGSTEYPATGLTGDPAASGYGGLGLIYSGNQVGRSLPPAILYSDWGFGRRHTRYGSDNPAVLDTNFAKHAVLVRGSWDTATIDVGEIFGFIDGVGVDIDLERSYNAFLKNLTIGPGHIVNCKHGIVMLRSTNITTIETVDAKITGVKMNLDPFRVATARGAGNTWATAAFSSNRDSADPTGIMAPYVRGLIISNCEFQNLAVPYTLEGGLNGSPSYNTLINNVVIADPVSSLGSSEFSTSNRGVGRIYPASRGLTYQIRDLDPAKGITYSSTVTISNASPGVVTWTAHGLVAGQQLVFATTGTLPSPLAAGNPYYVKTVLSANTFTVSTTEDGSAINTTTAGSGTHTATARIMFDTAKKGMLLQGSGLPTAGTYVLGHRYFDLTNSKEYVRLLTGEAHVDTVDWKEIGT